MQTYFYLLKKRLKTIKNDRTLFNTTDISLSIGKFGNKQIVHYFKERNLRGFVVFGFFSENSSHFKK